MGHYFLDMDTYILCKILYSGGITNEEEGRKNEKGGRKAERNYIKNGE